MSPHLQPTPRAEPGNVLLVEDDVLLREVLAEAMRDAGLTVIEAESADGAQRYITAGGQADLIISDFEMPGTMNGIQFGRWIRRNHPEALLILTSGKAGAQAEEIGLFIPKPYGVFEVVEIARKMVAAKQGDGI